MVDLIGAALMLSAFAAHVIVAVLRADRSHGPLIPDEHGE